MLMFYKIRSGVHEYYVSKLEESDRDTITFGGRKRCVVIHVDKDRREKIGYMSIAQFDKHCKLNGNLQRKSGTVNLIKVAMKFVCELYPHLSGKFKFDDNSTIHCLQGITLSLPHFYWAIYSKTWYEKHLNAYPIGSDYNMEAQQVLEEYRSAIKILKRKLKEKPDIRMHLTTMKASKRSYLLNCYDKTNSLKDFIVSFKNDGMDCSIYEGWLSKIVGPLMSPYDQILWQMEIDSTITIENTERLTNKPQDMFMVGGYHGVNYMFKGSN